MTSARARAVLTSSGGLLLFVAGLVVLWQAWVSLGDVDAIVAPRPSAVASDLVDDPGVYVVAALETLRTAAIGLTFGTLAGVALAVVVWWSPFLGAFLAPLTGFVRMIPVVAIIPVIARILGYGTVSVVTVTGLLTFSITYVLFGSGLRAIPTGTPELVVAYGGRRRDLLRRLALPSAVPALASGLRMAASVSVLAALAAEFLIGTDGLGALFIETRLGYAQVARSWGVAIVATAMSVAVFLSTTRLERAARRRFT